MRSTAFDFVQMIRDIEYLRSATILPETKIQIFEEMRLAMPPEQFCTTSIKSLLAVNDQINFGIVEQEIEIERTEKAKKKGRKTTKKSQHGAAPEHLFSGLDENGRGARIAEAVVD